METAAKGTLMDCAGCGELLADFLLDELPESEAVLVHEHLLICPECMKAYRELKGTGKALEAVTSMREVEGSETFKTEVYKQALIEADKIVQKLPPDRRLRLEARREARQSMRLSQRRPPPKVWSPGLLVLALAAVLGLALLLFWPRGEKPILREAVGNLSVALGKVDQFYKETNKPYTPVAEGKNVLPGDNLRTGENGRARIDLAESGSVFVGPAGDLAFSASPGGNGEFVLRLESGELGLLRRDAPTAPTAATPHDWEIQTPAGSVVLFGTSGSIHAWLRADKGEKATALEVLLLAGSGRLVSHDGSQSARIHAGQRAVFGSADTQIVVESASSALPPAWRADLLTDADLAVLFSGKAKIAAREAGAVQVELTYNHETRTQDWISETGAVLAPRGGALSCPSGVRWKHAAPFAAPLVFEFKFNADSRRDANFEFGALESSGGAVDVSVYREVVLRVKEKDKLPRQDRMTARNPQGAAESLLLQIKPEAAGYAATLNSTSGKTKSFPLSKEKAEAPGEAWFQALIGEGILLDEVKLSGTLSADWVLKRLVGE